MKLDDFLKCKKVRCVKGYDDCLKVGKEYDVIDVSVEIKVKDDEGEILYWEPDHFEPVLDSAENPLQDMKLTPEFETEASEPKFKVGDKVYVGLTGKIAQVTGIIDDDVVSVANKNNEVRTWVFNICHATQENYEKLCSLFERIDFDQPPKELKGSDLCRAMLDKGWNLVPCVISDRSDDDALPQDNVAFVNEWNGEEFEHGDTSTCVFAVPFDPKTGEPLTESVLDE